MFIGNERQSEPDVQVNGLFLGRRGAGVVCEVIMVDAGALAVAVGKTVAVPETLRRRNIPPIIAAIIVAAAPMRATFTSLLMRLASFVKKCNYSGTLFAPPAAAGEKNEDEARTPRAPAEGLRPPAPPAELLLQKNK